MQRPCNWPRADWFALSRRRRRTWWREQHPRIVCTCCGKRYRTAIPNSDTQGVRCAAQYANGVVYGHYGSTLVDMRKASVTVPGLPTRLNPVCDACIQGWVNAGYAPPLAQWQDYADFDAL